MPAAMRFAANAPRFAAAALFLNPQLRFALGVATWLAAAKFVWDEAQQQWVKSPGSSSSDISTSDGFEYRLSSFGDEYYPSLSQACDAFKNRVQPITPQYWTGPGQSSIESCTPTKVVIKKTGYYSGSPPTPASDTYDSLISRRSSSCPAGWYVTPAGCIQTPPPLNVNEQDFKDGLANNPMPQTVPDELPPGTPLPVEIPVINPAPGPLPATPPAPRPYFEPSGDPVPNPNYNPQAEPSPTNQPYIIPGTRIVPSPTPQEPFRVDVQPVERPTTSPTPLPPEELNPQPEPGTNPDQQNQDKPKPEEQQSLCEKHPEILACQKLDEVKEEPLGKEEVQIRINPLGGWGPDSAQCPAPMAANIAGQTVELSWQPVCGFAEGLRPIVIAMAWLSAASMLVVVARRN